MSNNPIGIFDSGVGGLSIWKEIISLIPNEDTIYLADSKNAPYGEKSKDEIISLCIKNTEKLISLGCKIIVVACNTATTNAISYLRGKYQIPFIGIEPAIKPASLQTKLKRIGILATKGTLNSSLFEQTSKKYMQDIEVIETIGTGIVPLIESNRLESPEMTTLIKKYIQDMLAQNIDCLVLGCTHYPFLIPQLKDIVGDSIKIIDSGLAVATQTKVILNSNHLLNSNNCDSGKHKIISNTKLTTLQSLIRTKESNTELIVEHF